MRYLLLILAVVVPLSAQAWWSDEWSYRKELAVDASPAGADIKTELEQAQVLVRLHSGNFGYFLDVMPNGEDLRFVAGDDVTPLKYRIEKFDPINGLALVWVQLPKIVPGIRNTFWMYYGNAQAVPGEDQAGGFDGNTVLAYGFNEAGTMPSDLTAFGQTPEAFTAEPLAASLIGSGVHFAGTGVLQVAATPALTIDPQSGWTWSAWLRIGQAQQSAMLLDAGDGSSRLRVTIDGTTIRARLANASGSETVTQDEPMLVPGNWQHVALVLDDATMTLYLDGSAVASAAAVTGAFTPALTIGQSATGGDGLVGDLDEVRVATTARSADWMRLAAGNGQPAGILVYGEDGQRESSDGGGESYFAITMRNVTVDGWVVIVFLAVMSAISWLVMVSKGMVIGRTRRDNAAFINDFKKLGSRDVAALDAPAGEDDDTAIESPLMLALGGRHDHYQSSTLYRLYHSGIQELETRMPKAVGAQAAAFTLTSQAIEAIRASMHATLVRESQRLNGQMVLLTIAISGGPFLGLLGTVVGVMITFAAIAAAGDVNVNAIAPGIAAALVATVAGLAVAIPALFGYNYLGTRIREISADMHVFVDEFVTKIAEHHT
jgi:biopolymer transport protein ExbB